VARQPNFSAAIPASKGIAPRGPTAPPLRSAPDAALGPVVRVTDLRTGRSNVMRINDRGPFVRGRVIDLSRAAASRLGMGGLARVRVEVLHRWDRTANAVRSKMRRR